MEFADILEVKSDQNSGLFGRAQLVVDAVPIQYAVVESISVSLDSSTKIDAMVEASCNWSLYLAIICSAFSMAYLIWSVYISNKYNSNVQEMQDVLCPVTHDMSIDDKIFMLLNRLKYLENRLDKYQSSFKSREGELVACVEWESYLSEFQECLKQCQSLWSSVYLKRNIFDSLMVACVECLRSAEAVTEEWMRTRVLDHPPTIQTVHRGKGEGMYTRSGRS